MPIKIDIELSTESFLGRSTAQVEAELLHDIAPHLAGILTFAVHKIPDKVFSQFGHKYRVTNLESGFCVGEADSNTKAEAIRKAREFLATKTPKEARYLLAKAMARN